jgi:hypothetical protein
VRKTKIRETGFFFIADIVIEWQWDMSSTEHTGMHFATKEK